MNISWVFANNTVLDPTINVDAIKNIGSTWGSWQTWRGCQTDNVICNDLVKGKELIQRNFQNNCNLYVPRTNFVDLGCPQHVNVYEGTFSFELDNPDDIISMHLAATKSDVVLLVGFDCSPKNKDPDRLIEHRAQNYRTAFKHTLLDNQTIQWVLIDHGPELQTDLKKLNNLAIDTIDNVFSLMS